MKCTVVCTCSHSVDRVGFIPILSIHREKVKIKLRQGLVNLYIMLSTILSNRYSIGHYLSVNQSGQELPVNT